MTANEILELKQKIRLSTLELNLKLRKKIYQIIDQRIDQIYPQTRSDTLFEFNITYLNLSLLVGPINDANTLKAIHYQKKSMPSVLFGNNHKIFFTHLVTEDLLVIIQALTEVSDCKIHIC